MTLFWRMKDGDLDGKWFVKPVQDRRSEDQTAR